MLLPALKAPDWHGHNLDALYDGLSGGINELEPPFKVIIHNSRSDSSDMARFLENVVTVFQDTRRDAGIDISLEVI